MNRYGLLLGSLLAATAWAEGTPGQFDYYVMALSWSPEHCAARPADAEQCSRPLGFVLHGLWPQYQRGYPAACAAERLQADIPRRFAGLYPSTFLFRHEWDKHGSCSGLSQPQFHQLAAQLKARFRAPAAYVAPLQPLRRSAETLKAELVAANGWLPRDSVALSCSGSGRFLKEVYLCLDKHGAKAAACGDDVRASERRSCRQPDFLVRSVR